MLKIIYLVLVFYQILEIRGQCQRFSLSDEEDTFILSRFLEKLEFYTGLDEDKPRIKVNCVNPICIVDSRGNAIWNARDIFYAKFISSETEENTLTKCLCSSTNTKFQECMQNVRSIMYTDLDAVLMDTFTKLVEKDNCKDYHSNCLLNEYEELSNLPNIG